jgi:hypothetical protein
MTEVRAADGAIRLSGHVSYREAVDQLRNHYSRMLAEASRTLAAIDAGEARVFHQRGIHVVRDRREIPPT